MTWWIFTLLVAGLGTALVMGILQAKTIASKAWHFYALAGLGTILFLALALLIEAYAPCSWWAPRPEYNVPKRCL